MNEGKFTMSYLVFTDATADMNDQMIAAFPTLRIIPMNVNLDGTEYLYGPGGNLNIRDFYAAQRDGKFASTSQITPFAYREMFEPVLKDGQDILYLCFSSGLSDTIEAARICAGELREQYPDRRIEIVDTLCGAVGEGFLVYEAMKEYEAGMDLDDLAAWAEARKMHVCHWFTVDTFDHLLHGGRVSSASAAVGTLLNIKPFLHVDDLGKLEVMGKPRGRKQATKKQRERMNEGWEPELGKFVLIGHGDNQEIADGLKADILKEHPDAEVQTAYIGPVIGAHTGPDMLALIYWGNNR